MSSAGIWLWELHYELPILRGDYTSLVRVWCEMGVEVTAHGFLSVEG